MSVASFILNKLHDLSGNDINEDQQRNVQYKTTTEGGTIPLLQMMDEIIEMTANKTFKMIKILCM
jgi:predicted transcriptional regulator